MKTKQQKNIRVLVIIPAYNEQKSILDVTQRALKAYPDVDVLVINDYSTDGTESILQQHNINHLSLSVNLGIGGAVQTGFHYARAHGYDITIQVDGDGQHPPEQIPELIKAMLSDDLDVVIGSRYMAGNQIVSSRARRFGGGLLGSMIYVATGKHIADPTSGFRAYSHRTLDYLCLYYPQEYPEPISAIELLLQGYKLAEVPIVMKERQYGSSSITGWNTFFYMLKVMFAIIIVRIRRRNR